MSGGKFRMALNIDKTTNYTQLNLYTIHATVLLENSFWVGIFERKDNEGYAVARQIFGDEPTDAELYEFVTSHFDELRFTEPVKFKLVIKRKNPKRLKREIRKVMKKTEKLPQLTRAQEVLKLDLEKKKKEKKVLSRSEKEGQLEKKFQLKQAKKKKKQRGH
ncbi:YjdF family protein [Coxiella burnetii]|uniref:Uncharacterized protein n=1 Tax=Coxiella burnetii (strain Dugway 5J108-111) TaxID=434922 RepID=A9KF24_COXBN|nr:YjdF family protein [Coxiella burnetii]ABS77245.2 hypothetical protein CBUD_0083 [Coxiella burnetii Dugway 5J108-111]ACJ19466.1 hypothetical protein CbuK_0149 [Coxiella burnetii CbuK_Q154]AIT62494.1 uncharacterized protein yjdF [Coxiella burnetii str. Namibia]OYK81143.1 DUF2992 domain-containing protein [Coxiella burnetii]OYK83234.1 DUF2992 domain-containing protein [Coxiella burnetii]